MHLQLAQASVCALKAKHAQRTLDRPRQDLASLETLHSVLTVYAWLSLRSGIVFHAYDLAVALRKAAEEAMGYCLSSAAARPERSFSYTGGNSIIHVMRGPFIVQASFEPLFFARAVR